MSIASSLLIAASLVIRQAPAEPTVLRGEVLGKFDEERILLSFGSDQGVRKGLRGTILRIKANSNELFVPKDPSALPEVSQSPFVLQWAVEFVDVAAKHSVARRISEKQYLPWELRFPAGDPVVWRDVLPWEVRDRHMKDVERHKKEAAEFEARRNELEQSMPRFIYGGAIIDLTRPAEVRVPRKQP
jgi:hypothetical protein